MIVNYVHIYMQIFYGEPMCLKMLCNQLQIQLDHRKPLQLADRFLPNVEFLALAILSDHLDLYLQCHIQLSSDQDQEKIAESCWRWNPEETGHRKCLTDVFGISPMLSTSLLWVNTSAGQLSWLLSK